MLDINNQVDELTTNLDLRTVRKHLYLPSWQLEPTLLLTMQRATNTFTHVGCSSEIVFILPTNAEIPNLSLG